MDTSSKRLAVHIDTLMSDGNERNIKQIKDEINLISDEIFTDGMVSGVLFRMIKNSTLIKPRRSFYKAATIGDLTPEKKLVSVIEKTSIELKKIVDNIDILDASEADLEIINTIRKLKSTLDDISSSIDL